MNKYRIKEKKKKGYYHYYAVEKRVLFFFWENARSTDTLEQALRWIKDQHIKEEVSIIDVSDQK